MRRGFTLIEILVVLGITVLLLAIAIPALIGARKRSEQAQCGNNLRQIMAGCINYSLESRQYMMFSNSQTLEQETDPAKPRWTTAGWLYNWHDASRSPAFPASRPVGYSGFRGDDIKNGVLWHYVSTSRKTYFCPSSKETLEEDTGNAEVMTSYMMNAAVTGLGTKVLPFKMDRFEPKHIAFWEPQEGPTGNWNDGNIEPTNGRTERHVDGLNVVGFDGHVEFWTNFKFDEQKNTSNASQLWCDPRYPDTGRAP